MFYSVTLLAKKGPLGVVWCAAHMQHRLRKSHYISTDIPSTVERIMNPEVPFALRMSADLLLGVVRIFFRQVDYLHRDCNAAVSDLGKIYSYDKNLPEDTTHSPDASLILPKPFDLDSVEIGDDFQLRHEDDHCKQPEDITLEDQVPTGRDQPYTVFTRNEDVRKENTLETDPVPMEEDSRPSLLPMDGNQENIEEVGTAQDLPEIEIMRDAEATTAGHEFPDLGYDVVEPDKVLEDLIMKDTPIHAKEILASEQQPSIPTHESNVHSLEHTRESLDIPFSLRHSSPELAVRPSTPAVKQPRPRGRKRRKMFFDETTVLSNAFMNKSLENTSNILRKKRHRPSTDLELDIRLKKDAIFHNSIITGLCSELRSNFNPKPHHLLNQDTTDFPTSSPLRMEDNTQMEIENLRNYEPSSPPAILDPALHSRQAETNLGSEMQHPTVELTPPVGFLSSELETPAPAATYSRERHGLDNAGLSDIPESPNGDLNFLDQDDNTPGSGGTPEIGLRTVTPTNTTAFHSLPTRTRAIAQYLRKQSFAATPNPDQSSGNLSLNSILENKSRKKCARMFYETLVLKNCGLIDVNQDEPYGDIKLQLTTKFSEEVIL